MMTFLPFADFAASAAALDMRRLQNQRTEARFVLEWLEQSGPHFDLSEYGAARMWKGFRDALAMYYNAMLAEYERRGKTNGPTLQPAAVPATVEMPPWLGDHRFHSSHRAVLLQKDAAYYGALDWPEEDHEFNEYLYPHLMEDGRWGLYPQVRQHATIIVHEALFSPPLVPAASPQSKYKKRTIVAIAHGELLLDAAAGKLSAATVNRAKGPEKGGKPLSTPKPSWHERRAPTVAHTEEESLPSRRQQQGKRSRVVADDGSDDEDVPLSARPRKAPAGLAERQEPRVPTAAAPEVVETPTMAAVVKLDLTQGTMVAAVAAASAETPVVFASTAATPSRAALVAEYERLTKRELPKMAAERRFPIRFDHCFQRVVLDAAFGGCWYDHLDRKKGPAIKQIGDAPLARAVAAARRMAEEGIEAVRELDAQSLRWRGKQPKRTKG